MSINADRRNQLPAESRRRDALIAVLRDVHKFAHKAVHYRDLATELRRRVNALDLAAEDFATATIRQQVRHWVIVAGYLPLLAADLTLSAPTFQYYASMYLRLDGPWLTLAMLAGPLVVFFLELSIAAQRMDYLETRAVDGLAHRALAAAGVTLAIVMASMVFATQMARYTASASATAAQVFWLRAWAMAGLALVVHLAVALAGRAPAEAKAYATYASRRWWLDTRIRMAERAVARNSDAAWDVFSTYQTALDRLGEAFQGTRIEPGPLDRATADLLNARARGPAADASPEAPPGNPGTTPNANPNSHPNSNRPSDRFTAAQAIPPASPAGGGEAPPSSADAVDDGELQYYQSVLRDRIREAESEVRP